MALLFCLQFPFAFVNRGIYVDEAWIGQQVYTLLHDGEITTSLFADLPPIDRSVVIYHKLVVWVGLVFSACCGWGLYSLRASSMVAGLSLLILVFIYCKQTSSSRQALVACLVLLWTPLTWNQMRIFRPEMLVALFGFGSFLMLHTARRSNSVTKLLFAGLFAGLSGLAHPLGLAFAVSGCVALLLEKRYRWCLGMALLAAVGFFPYFTGYFTDQALFLQQSIGNHMMQPMLKLAPRELLWNLLCEHKRMFRSPEVTGLSVLWGLSLIINGRKSFFDNRFFWSYSLVLMALVGMAPLPKITRYMMLTAPLMVIPVAKTLVDTFDTSLTVDRWRFIKRLALLWMVVFVIFGEIDFYRAAFVRRTAPAELSAGRQTIQLMKSGTFVIAPYSFVFAADDSFRVQSWVGTYLTPGIPRNLDALEHRVDSLGAEYLIFDPEVLERCEFTPRDLTHLRSYSAVKSFVEPEWYVFRSNRSVFKGTAMSQLVAPRDED